MFLGFGGLVAYFVLAGAPVPGLLRELPNGSMVQYHTRGLSDKDLLPGTEETATVIGDRLRVLQIEKGKYAVAAIEAKFTGHRRQTVQGYPMLVSDGEAVHVTATRVLQGSPELVAEALRIREGKATSFADSLTAEERAAIRKLPGRSDVFVVARGGGAGFFVASGSKTGNEISATFVGPCKDDADQRRLESELRKDGTTLVSSERSGRFLVLRIKTAKW